MAKEKSEKKTEEKDVEMQDVTEKVSLIFTLDFQTTFKCFPGTCSHLGNQKKKRKK